MNPSNSSNSSLKKEGKKVRKDSLEDKAELSTDDEAVEGTTQTVLPERKRNEE